MAQGPHPEAPAVEFDGVGLTLPNGRRLLADLSLAIAPGETLVLLGRSGCGKSTTMRLVNRLLLPTEGTVKVEGRPTTAWDPIALRRHIGYVLQDAALFPHLTVARNVGLVPGLLGWAPERIEARVAELLALVGLAPEAYAERAVSELSGGQRQRVGIARALAADAPILLLDEPFSALDPITRREMQREFKALSARLGKTMIFVTHDIHEALRLGDRLALLHAGRLAFWGTPAEFLTATHPEAVAFREGLELPPGLAA